MNDFEIALAVGATITAILARRLPRSLLWICGGAASFAASAIYWRLGLPYHPAFTLVCDWLVCFAIYLNGREEWEMRLFNVFQMSVLISLLKIAGLVPDGVIYAVALEACNWIALLLISGTAILAGAGHGNRFVRRWINPVHRSMLSLRKARAAPPFTRVRR